MGTIPQTIDELLNLWDSYLSQLDKEKPEDVASWIVGAVTSSDHWDGWEENEKIEEIFELAAALEVLPQHINSITSDKDIPKDFERIKQLISELRSDNSYM